MQAASSNSRGLIQKHGVLLLIAGIAHRLVYAGEWTRSYVVEARLQVGDDADVLPAVPPAAGSRTASSRTADATFHMVSPLGFWGCNRYVKW